jgi:diguanylate cyclase (GGDEF)-like protein
MPHRWETLLAELTDRASSDFISHADLSAELAELLARPESTISGVQFDLPLGASDERVHVGPAGEGEAPERLTFQLGGGAEGAVLIWREAGDEALRRQVAEGLSRLGAAVFAGDRRDEKSGLISTQVPGTAASIDRTLQRMLEDHGSVSVIYADLDGFKRVNDTEDHDAGDKVIAETALILERTAAPGGLVVRDGGDEFALLCPGPIEQGLVMGREIARAFGSHGFSTQVDVGITMGLRPVAQATPIPTFRSLRTDAEAVTKEIDGDGEHTGEKRRGRISIWIEENDDDHQLDLEDQLARARAVIKSLVGYPQPFRDAWLNLISQQAAEALLRGDLETLAAEIEDLAGWIAPDWSDGCEAAARLTTTEEIPTFSRLDLCIAAAHGVLRAVLIQGDDCACEPDDQLQVLFEDGKGASLLLGTEPLVDLGSGAQELGLGGFVFRDGDAEIDSVDTRSAILVQVGDRMPASLLPLFYEAITVDDRPTVGGGLPDFWEATVARVVAAARRSPNVDFLAVVGPQELALHTVEQLEGMSTWNPGRSWELSEKTATDPRDIEETGKQLAGGRHFCELAEETVEKLAEHLGPGRTVGEVSPPPEGPGPIRISREWTANDLDHRDGFRVRTLREAFPLVLQVLGGTLDREDFQIVDAAGIEMSDLRDVKILFEAPAEEQIPAFYHDRKDSLEEYFQANFIDSEGKFSKAITSDQYQRVVEHLVHAISREQPFSTRRANIVLPHDLTTKDAPDLSPLGLVSVRCIPRFSRTGIRLHFSFTWRTVEALVGFPYSAFGSMRYAETLADAIRSGVEEKGNAEAASQIGIADISYIAHSLHMATDAYGRRIAHKIIAG